jgi:SRSO17 transposase
VLVVDGTGCFKKATHSVGVAPRYSGTAGWIKNCQIGAFASHASRWGYALNDRRLFLRAAWANAPERRVKAHVPEDVAFDTRPPWPAT